VPQRGCTGESLGADSLFFDRFRLATALRKVNCAKNFLPRTRAHNERSLDEIERKRARFFRASCVRRSIFVSQKNLISSTFLQFQRFMTPLLLRSRANARSCVLACARVHHQVRAKRTHTRFVKRDAVFFVVL
jgi:hypothetical protein